MTGVYTNGPHWFLLSGTKWWFAETRNDVHCLVYKRPMEFENKGLSGIIHQFRLPLEYIL